MPTKEVTAISLIDKLKKREDLLRVLIFSLVTVFIWIGLSIFLSQRDSKVPLDVQKHVLPLNPNIDRTIFPELSSRKKYTPEELTSFDIYQLHTSEEGSYSVSSIFQPDQTVTVTPAVLPASGPDVESDNQETESTVQPGTEETEPSEGNE